MATRESRTLAICVTLQRNKTYGITNTSQCPDYTRYTSPILIFWGVKITVFRTTGARVGFLVASLL